MAINIRTYKKRSLVSLFGRLCQLVGAIAVCVYYGKILTKAIRNDVYGDARWIYATTVGAISGASALGYLFCGILSEPRPTSLLFAWDVIVVILWTVVSGIFGSMYLLENPEMDQGITDMKVAAWFDLANLLLWMVSACYAGWAVLEEMRKRAAEKAKKADKEKGEKEAKEADGDGKKDGGDKPAAKKEGEKK